MSIVPNRRGDAQPDETACVLAVLLMERERTERERVLAQRTEGLANVWKWRAVAFGAVAVTACALVPILWPIVSKLLK